MHCSSIYFQRFAVLFIYFSVFFGSCLSSHSSIAPLTLPSLPFLFPLFIFQCFSPISSTSTVSSRIFLGMLGFGLSIMFCTTFCRACSRYREEQIEREVWRRTEQDGRPPPIYFIPFHGSMSHQDGDDHPRAPRYSQENHTPPQYSNAAYSGPPPSYNELGLKPEDLPPAYTEYSVPVYPITPPPPSDMVQPQTQSQ